MAGGGRPGPQSPAYPPDNEDLLSDILLRLPPAPSSLPRASLVCKRWRRVVSDPVFLRRFRARHRRSAPLLGFFTQGWGGLSFTPTLDPPDRLPRGHFSLHLDGGCRILCCRHGLVLILDRARLQVLVWDPVTGYLSRIAFPPGFGDGESAVVNHGAVLRGTNDVHGGGDNPIPFLVALVGNNEVQGATRAFACVYSSETGIWGNLISTACPAAVPVPISSTLVGGSLYWLLGWNTVAILEFDLDRQCLAVIDVPSDVTAYSVGCCCVIPAEGGGLGFLLLSGYNAQLWARKTDFNGVVGWVLGRTIELDKLLSLNSEEGLPPIISGFAEEDNMSFLVTNMGIFMVQLESMQFKKPFEMLNLEVYHPLASVYTAGMDIGGRRDGAELLQNT